MKLNYHIQGEGQPIILLHGLFGNLTNLGVLARAFMADYQVIQVDLRNHGLSHWVTKMNYSLMAEDIIELIDQLSLDQVIIIGHSMGGKVAMRLTELIPSKLKHVIVLDIAPVVYSIQAALRVINAIDECDKYLDWLAYFEGVEKIQYDKLTVKKVLSTFLDDATLQFIFKSYKANNHWQFNYAMISIQLPEICGWETVTPYFHPILFIRGGQSDYVIDEYQGEILNQFPYAVIETIPEAGHNVHAEKPQQVIDLIKQWIK